MWLILVVMLSGKVWKGHTNVLEPVKDRYSTFMYTKMQT